MHLLALYVRSIHRCIPLLFQINHLFERQVFLVRETCHLQFLKFHFLFHSWGSNIHSDTDFAHIAVLIACHICSTV